MMAAHGTTTAEQRDHWEGDHSRRRSWDHPSVGALFAPRADFLARELNSRSAAVLDVGCGNGFLTMQLERHFDSVTAVDFAAAMLAINPARTKLQADATRLPFPDKSFDAAVSSHMLHHMEPHQQEAAVRELARVARKLVVIWEPRRSHPAMFLFGALVPHERELLRFPASRLRSLMQSAKLSQVQLRAEGLITPNLCPAFLAPIARTLGNTPLRSLGMYIRATGTPSGAAGTSGGAAA